MHRLRPDLRRWQSHTAIEVLRNVVAWFTTRGTTIERVLSDNGSACKSHAWRDACAELGIRPKKTRPYRRQVNGKVERFHRTLSDGWALGRFYSTEQARRKALTGPTPPPAANHPSPA
jgi:transposase InsO family protein